ncbi:MAG: beta strand repeat-containing protein, partial [Prochlorothrix sp.]
APTLTVSAGGRIGVDAKDNGTELGTAGSITISGATAITINSGTIGATTEAGSGGLIEILNATPNATTVDILSGGAINSSTVSGTAGDIRVTADGSVTVAGAGSTIESKTGSGGTAGSVTITSDRLNLASTGSVSVGATGTGTAGSILVSAPAIDLDNGVIEAVTAAGGESSPGNITLQNIRTFTATNNSLVSASTDTGLAGSVTIGSATSAATTVDLTDSTIEAKATGARGNAGAVTLYTADLTSNASNIQSSNISGTNATGNVLIEEIQTLTATNGTNISASTDTGLAGNVTIGASGSAATTIDLTGSTIEAKATGAGGNAGAVTLYTADLTSNASNIQSSNISGTNATGNVLIEEIQTLTATNGTNISASTDTGLAGNVTIGASGSAATTIDLTGSTIEAKATGAGGNAGAVTVYTNALTANTSTLQASNESGSAGSGNVVLGRLNTLALVNSSLLASTQTGTAGSVLINNGEAAIPRVSLTGASLISVEADTDDNPATGTGTGQAGQIVVNTNQLSLLGDSTGRAVISAATEGGDSQGIRLDNLNRLEIIQGELTASTVGGNAANLQISGPGGTALDQVYLNDGKITVAATGSGTAGQLSINTVDLTAENQSAVSASTNTGQGQSILLQGLNNISLTNSNISASTIDGVAGSITVNQSETPIQTVNLNQGSLSVAATGTGSSGDILLNALNLLAQNRSEISASTNSGTGGGVNLTNIKTLELQNSNILAATQTGTAGSISINKDAVAVPIVRILGASRISVEADTDGNATTGVGNGTAGQITINANELFLRGNSRAQITASTENGSSQGIAFQNLDRLTVIQGDITATTVGGSAADLVIGNDNGSTVVPLSQITLNDGNLSVEATGSGTAGQLVILAETLNATNGSLISAATNSGSGQGITLSGLQTLSITNSSITASTVDGSAGNILVNSQTATAPTIALNQGNINVAATGLGSSGSINLNASTLTLQNDSTISASTNLGVGGSVLLPNLLNLSVENSQIQATTTAGEAGSVVVNAANGVQVQGVLRNGQAAGLSVEATAAGRAGNLTVTTPELRVSDGAVLSVAAGGSAQGGNLSITPWGSGRDLVVTLNGGTISGSTQGSGVGGSLSFQATDTLLLRGQGRIAAESSGSGTAGSVNLNALYVTIADGIELSTSTTSSGRGGDVTVTAGNRFLLNNAQISTNAAGVGNGGDIRILVETPANNLVLDNIVLNRGLISAESQRSQGGSISFRSANSLILYNSSLISTGAGELGNGGDINLFAKFVIGMPRSDRDLGNNDVVANAIFGNGGRINLTAEGLFGFLVRSVDNPRLDSRNNITASSRFGTTGIVSISTNVDPSQGLTALAVDLLDPSSLIDRRCSLRSSASQSQFTLAGRGGLAPAPGSGVELSSTGDDLRLSLSGNGETQGIAALSQGLGTVKLSAWGGSMGTDADPNGGLRRSALAQGVGVPRLGDCQ